MKKVIVIGCPGSGKSYFSKKLEEKTKLPLYHLDNIYHKEDKTHISREEFDEILKGILSKDEWIIDGNYQRTLRMRIDACDTVFLLDFDTDVCVMGARLRVGKKRDDMSWYEDELDKDFEKYIISFKTNNLPEIYEVLDEYKDSKNIIVFKNREEVDNWLSSFTSFLQ